MTARPPSRADLDAAAAATAAAMADPAASPLDRMKAAEAEEALYEAAILAAGRPLPELRAHARPAAEVRDRGVRAQLRRRRTPVPSRAHEAPRSRTRTGGRT